MNNHWNYQPKPPHFAKSGNFTAHISGSGSRTDLSAAAVSVIQMEGPDIKYEAIFVSRDGSTSPRAHHAAVVGALEAVPYGAALEICTVDENTAYLLQNDLAGWEANGWRKADGSIPANLDILKRISDTIREKGLKVTVKLVRDRKSIDGLTIEALKKKANERRKQESLERAA